MRAATRAVVTAGLTLLAGWALAPAGADQGRPVLPAPDFEAVVKDSVGRIQAGLDRGDKKLAALVRTNALLVILAAQDQMRAGGGKSGQLAALQDTGVKLARAAQGPKLDVAAVKAEMKRLEAFPMQIGDAPGGPGPVPFKNLFDIDDVMNVFRKAGKGGQDLEKDLLNLGMQKRSFTAEQMAPGMVLAADKTALVARLAARYDQAAKGQVKEWQAWTADMEKYARDLAAAARAGDNKQVKAALKKLNTTCADCHAAVR